MRNDPRYEGKTADAIITGWEDISDRQHRILVAAVRLCVAVEAGDSALVEDFILDAAHGFRAVVEENCP